MSDVSFCDGYACPLKDDCYRFFGKTEGSKHVYREVPYDHATKSCGQYWKIENQFILTALKKKAAEFGNWE